MKDIAIASAIAAIITPLMIKQPTTVGEYAAVLLVQAVHAGMIWGYVQGRRNAMGGEQCRS